MSDIKPTPRPTPTPTPGPVPVTPVTPIPNPSLTDKVIDALQDVYEDIKDKVNELNPFYNKPPTPTPGPSPVPYTPTPTPPPSSVLYKLLDVRHVFSENRSADELAKNLVETLNKPTVDKVVADQILAAQKEANKSDKGIV